MISAASEAGKLLENPLDLGEQATLTQRRKLLLAMLDAVYVDIVEEKSVVAIQPKPAFGPVFHLVTAREGIGVVLIKESPQAGRKFGETDIGIGRIEVPSKTKLRGNGSL